MFARPNLNKIGHFSSELVWLDSAIVLVELNDDSAHGEDGSAKMRWKQRKLCVYWLSDFSARTEC